MGLVLAADKENSDAGDILRRLRVRYAASKYEEQRTEGE